MILAALVVAGFAGNAFAQETPASATGTANATVIAPITLTDLQDLSFGRILSGVSDGPIVLGATSNTSLTPADAWQGSQADDDNGPERGVWKITCEPNVAMTLGISGSEVTYPDNGPATVTMKDIDNTGSHTLAVQLNYLGHNTSQSGSPATSSEDNTLASTGSATWLAGTEYLFYGAQIANTTGTTSGDYQGSFTITAQYQ